MAGGSSSTCGNICPTGAISFPRRDSIRKLEWKRQIFRAVKKEAPGKHHREEAQKARHEALATAAATVPTRARVEIAGEFGDKRFLLRLEALIEGKPFDIVGLRLEVPTPKGARQKVPS